MISIVIINKDEMAVDDTLSDVVRQAKDFGEPAEVIVVDAPPDGRGHEEVQKLSALAAATLAPNIRDQ